MILDTNYDKLPANIPDYLDRMFHRGKYQPSQKPAICKNYIDDFKRPDDPAPPRPDNDSQATTKIKTSNRETTKVLERTAAKRKRPGKDKTIKRVRTQKIVESKTVSTRVSN